MYGLRSINNHYPAGCRGDWIVVGHPEYNFGRSKPLPYMTACLGRPSKPAATFAGRGPRPMSRERLRRMIQGTREPKTPLARSKSASDPAAPRCLTLLDCLRAREQQHSNTASLRMQSGGCSEPDKRSEDELKPSIPGSTATDQTKARIRPQSALPGKMQQDVLQKQASDVPLRTSARPTSAPACSRSSADMTGRRERMPAQECSRAVLPRTAAEARKALEELRASLGLDVTGSERCRSQSAIVATEA